MAFLQLEALKRQSMSWADRGRAAARYKTLRTRLEHGGDCAPHLSLEGQETVAYHLQGNESLSTEEGFKERQKLRRHPRVLDELSRWWKAALAGARQRRPDAITLSKDDYVGIYRLLYRDLLGEEDYDPHEAEAEAAEEWRRDSSDGLTMERACFLDAMFELIDLYSLEISPHAYASSMPSTLTILTWHPSPPPMLALLI